MTSETELRRAMDYDDAHLPVLSGPLLARQARRRQMRRRVARGGVAMCLAGVVVGSGIDYWQDQPHVVSPDITYASGPTQVLPDGRIDTGMGEVRAWIDSKDRMCFGDAASNICRPVSPATASSTEDGTGSSFPMLGPTTDDGTVVGKALVGGPVHERLHGASFTTPDGRDLKTLVIRFEKFPDWSLVVAAVPTSADGTVPTPEQLEFSAH